VRVVKSVNRNRATLFKNRGESAGKKDAIETSICSGFSEMVGNEGFEML